MADAFDHEDGTGVKLNRLEIDQIGKVGMYIALIISSKSLILK